MPSLLRPARVLLLLAFTLAPGLWGQVPAAENLTFAAEWRLIRAGTVELRLTGGQTNLKLYTQGLVQSLYKVDDTYRANYSQGRCLVDSLLEAHEGKRDREAKVTVDRTAKKAYFLERDMVRNATVATREVEVPACVYDVLTALHKLREMLVEPGQKAEIPITDGKKFVIARVEAQERETVKTPLGEFKTIRYEAFLFDGVFYGRKGRLFIWLSEDPRRLPVQIRIQLPFYIGTVNLQLEKQEHP
jgi:hypothetical protein